MSQTEEQRLTTITDYLQEGNKLREEGKLDLAISQYEKALKIGLPKHHF